MEAGNQIPRLAKLQYTGILQHTDAEIRIAHDSEASEIKQKIFPDRASRH